MIKIEIMQGLELGCKDFTGKIKMTQITAREMATAVAVTKLIHRTRVAGELGPLDADLSCGGEKGPVTGISSRKDTIE